MGYESSLIGPCLLRIRRQSMYLRQADRYPIRTDVNCGQAGSRRRCRRRATSNGFLYCSGTWGRVAHNHDRVLPRDTPARDPGAGLAPDAAGRSRPGAGAVSTVPLGSRASLRRKQSRLPNNTSLKEELARLEHQDPYISRSWSPVGTPGQISYNDYERVDVSQSWIIQCIPTSRRKWTVETHLGS